MIIDYVFEPSDNNVAYKKVGNRDIPCRKTDIINIIGKSFETHELTKGIMIEKKEYNLIRFRDKKSNKILKIYFPKENGKLKHNIDHIDTLKNYVVSKNKIKTVNKEKMAEINKSKKKMVLKKIAIIAAISAIGIPACFYATEALIEKSNKQFTAEHESYKYDEHYIKAMQHKEEFNKSEIEITEEELKYYKSIFDTENTPNELINEQEKITDEYIKIR
ncbi:MAG TPA: hypothetical protein GX747_00060 [Tenericutes bacterium]|nr:hypothetical protein [Mycoplasmatota bacterium]